MLVSSRNLATANDIWCARWTRCLFHAPHSSCSRRTKTTEQKWFFFLPFSLVLIFLPAHNFHSKRSAGSWQLGEPSGRKSRLINFNNKKKNRIACVRRIFPTHIRFRIRRVVDGYLSRTIYGSAELEWSMTFSSLIISKMWPGIWAAPSLVRSF